MVPHCTPVGNVDYRWRNFCRTLPVCFWKVKSDPPADHLVTFAGHLQETLPVQDRDLPLTGCNQTGFFELSHGIGNRRALHSQHFGEQGLRDPQKVVVGPVIHHEQPPRKALFHAMSAVTCTRHQYLLARMRASDCGRPASLSWLVRTRCATSSLHFPEVARETGPKTLCRQRWLETRCSPPCRWSPSR